VRDGLISLPVLLLAVRAADSLFEGSTNGYEAQTEISEKL
jgi:hypothetical protein